jgi:hypothetical protein
MAVGAGLMAAALAGCSSGGASAAGGMGGGAVGAAATAPARAGLAAWPTRVLQVDEHVGGDYSVMQFIRRQSFGSEMPPATVLGFRVAAAGRILALSDARVESFEDDLGTDLGSGRAVSQFPDRTEPVARLFGGQVVVRLESAKTPAAGATRLIAKGTVVVQVGEGEETLASQEVVLRVGRGMKRSGGSLVLTEMSDGTDRGQRGLWLRFVSSGDMRWIKEVKVTAAGESGTGVEPTVVVDPAYGVSVQLDHPVEAVNLTVTLYKRVETKELPFSVSTGMGLADVKEQP